KLRIAQRYEAAFADQGGIRNAPRAQWASPSFWLYTVRIDPKAYGDDRNGVLAKLRSSAIEARPIWAPVHAMPPYLGSRCIGGQVATAIFSEAVSLPSSPQMDEVQQDRVIDVLRR